MRGVETLPNPEISRTKPKAIRVLCVRSQLSAFSRPPATLFVEWRLRRNVLALRHDRNQGLNLIMMSDKRPLICHTIKAAA